MANIHVLRPHHLPHADARAVAEAVAADLAKTFGLDYAWDGEILRFHTFGARGELRVAVSDIQLDVTLGAFLLPYRDKLETEIHRQFDKHLAADPTPGSSAQAA